MTSYVDPRVIDLFNDGLTISPALAATDDDLSDGTTHGKIERAVLNLVASRRLTGSGEGRVRSSAGAGRRTRGLSDAGKHRIDDNLCMLVSERRHPQQKAVIEAAVEQIDGEI